MDGSVPQRHEEQGQVTVADAEGPVVLHKRAFGPQATKLNKLESKEAYGPYRILEV
eukprot:SAG31_NODE_3529_length_4152_cov_3.993338_2_plen_55_part_01